MYSIREVQRAVIPVGGLGTRLLPVTKVLPKELLPVGRRPVVQYVVEEMRAARMDHICLVTGRKKTLIQEHFDHDPELVRHLQDRGSDELLAELAYLESGLNLSYIRQSGPQGLADAIGLVEDFVGPKPFVVALGDSMICEQVTGSLVRRMVREHIAHNAAATVAVEAVPVDRTHLHTMVRPESSAPDGEAPFGITDLVQQPPRDQTPGNWALAARFVFSPVVFSAIRETRPDRGGETQLTDAIRILAREGQKVQGIALSSSQRRLDIGTFSGYYRAFLEFALRDPGFSQEVRTYLEEAAAPATDLRQDTKHD
jgi:UTP--glucose-1-phosphate uridylyltransferase